MTWSNEVFSPQFVNKNTAERKQLGMNIIELIKWQSEGYAKFHRSKLNLWIHILAVPTFIIAFFSLIESVLTMDALQFLYSFLLTIVAIVLQGIGHSKEVHPPEKFTGPVNTITRILLEQLYTFPKFVLSGDWYKAIRPNK